MMFPTLETERLDLVEITVVHTQSYFDIMSRDDVTLYYGMESLTSIDEASKIIESFGNGFHSKRGIRWGMILKETGEYIGSVGLNNLNIVSKKAEVGYELHPSYWGKGLTTEAVKAILQYSFDELDLYRMGAITYPQNTASTKLLEKIGFQKEGLLRGYLFQYSRSHDAFVFSILQSEWKALGQG